MHPITLEREEQVSHHKNLGIVRVEEDRKQETLRRRRRRQRLESFRILRYGMRTTITSSTCRMILSMLKSLFRLQHEDIGGNMNNKDYQQVMNTM